MEASPLTRAHDHARAASVATHGPTADSTVAANEHVLAAGEFANAAKSTTSLEALRTLRLLEEHHQRLSELLQIPFGHSIQQGSTESERQDVEEKPIHSSSDSAADQKPLKSEHTSLANMPKPMAPTPALSHQRRYPGGRGLTSSIASNLASARGIRSKYQTQPLSPSVSNDQAPGNLEVHPRKDSSKPQSLLDQAGKPSWVPPGQVASQPRTEPTRHTGKEAHTAEQSSSGASEEGFSRFYNTFGSIINRLSAPLAFAGLPLITEEPTPEPPPVSPVEPSPQKRAQVKPPQRVNPEPDLGKIYSRAALRAISRESHGPNDSFYVVPTSGHTVSYANILNWEQKERRRLAASVHGDDGNGLEELDEDDFVDARESQAPMSPGARAKLGKAKTEKDMQNVVEELYLENASLKEMLDKLSKRLHAFELNSQTSHLALAQSLRLNRPGSPLSSSGGGQPDGADEALRRRNRELEEQLASTAKQMEALEKEYSKSQLTLEKYRDKWEKLKAGARARREANQGDNGEPSRS